jgi:hypothetical protein
MEIKLRNSKKLKLDSEKWLISNNPICEIIEVKENEILFQNRNGIKAIINSSILEANDIEIQGNQLFLTKSMYERYIVKPEIEKSNERFNKLFQENSKIIFQNKELVFAHAEFYLLRPNCFFNGSSLGAAFNFCLGTLFESIKSGNHYHLDSFLGYRNLFLVSLKGSLLSGSFCSTFWSETEKEIISFNSQESQLLPDSFNEILVQFRKDMKEEIKIEIDFHEKALQLLIAKSTKQKS